MNEIELIAPLPQLKGVAEFAGKVAEAEKSIGLVLPCAANAKLCSEEVTKVNKERKDIQSVLQEARAEWSKPLEAALAPLTEAQKSFDEKAADYQKKVLIAKKEGFKAFALNEYEAIVKTILSAGSFDGELPPFEAVYDDSLYGAKVSDLHDALVKRIGDYAKQRKLEAEAAAEPAGVEHWFKIVGLKEASRAADALAKAGIKFESDL